ncbi:MAG: hypothetical protein AAF195_00270 [Pseudomonadota bacterium]
MRLSRFLLFKLLILFFLYIFIGALSAQEGSDKTNNQPSNSSNNKADNENESSNKFLKKFVPKENYKLDRNFPPVQNNVNPSINELPDIKRTANLSPLYLKEGEEIPVPQFVELAYISNIYVAAILEDGRNVEIITDNDLRTTAFIVKPGARNQYLPNGHYELYKRGLYRLPNNEYSLTDDTSILLSIYEGTVINYVPNWAVKQGLFVSYELEKR